jgi:hypothetical protein
LSFLDERDDQPRPPRPPRRPPPGGPQADPQTLLVRRAIAIGGGLLVLLLLFFGIRGCQASQKEQGFKDYVRDVEELVAESDQQSTSLFDLLENPGNSQVDFTSNINGSKVQAEQLVDRAKSLDVPDQLKGAQSRLEDTLEFRRDGLDGIAQEAAGATDTGGGSSSSSGGGEDTSPNERIAAQMQSFLTSDVIYSQRFLPDLLSTIEDEDLDQDVPVPASLTDPETIQFLPDIQWLQPSYVSDQLGAIGSGGSDEPATPGLHGNGLGSVTVQPSGTQLAEGAAAQIPFTEDTSFDIEIADQGDQPESDVVVSVEIAGSSGEPIHLEETLDAINPGESKVVNVPLADTPPIGEQVDITVRVEPVPGEEKTDNNEATFTAIFSR